MRIVFAGTPDFAARHLQALLASQHKVVAVYTQPDRPAGRGKKLQPSAVKTLALQNNLPVYQPESLKPAEQQQILAGLNADVMVVVAYGLLLPQAVLDTPGMGCINVHGSLLPRWRGAAPIQRAVWAGDTESGVAIMQMEAGLDTGPVLLERRCEIKADETSASLYAKLEVLGPPALVEALDNLAELQQKAQPQNHQQATYAKKLSKEEGRIDWQQTADQLNRNVHAFNPWPTAWFTSTTQDDKPLVIKVLASQSIEQNSNEPAGTIVNTSAEGIDVACGTGILRIIAAQMPGKKAQPAAQLFNGYRTIFSKGNQLT
ncbi:methionyl-tRNA formyltransferase [Idiomarina seosinensis]|uniref:methionyl-tRNA formyltransferase n=1 Tax=Idiomarina seosinensis TaxID=281739 RepID=UPI00384B95B7